MTTLILGFFRASPPRRYESRLNLFPRWPSVKTKTRHAAAGRRLEALSPADSEYIFPPICRKMTQRGAVSSRVPFGHGNHSPNEVHGESDVSRLRPASRCRA